MSKNFFIMLLACTALCTACGNINSGQENIAAIDMKKAIAVHPDYEKLQQEEQVLKDLKQKKAAQEKLVEAQLLSLSKLEELKQISEKTYLTADYNTKIYAAQAKENFKLERARMQVENEAENLIADRKDNIEESYRLKMFNLRMRLESVKMPKDEKELLRNELIAERSYREEKINELEAEKDIYVKEKMLPHIQLMHSNMEAESMRLQKEVDAQLQKSKEKYSAMYAKASPALKNMLDIMDKQIVKQESRNNELRKQIDTDIEKSVQLLAEKNGYSIVLKDVKANIKAQDITEQVMQSLKKIK